MNNRNHKPLRWLHIILTSMLICMLTGCYYDVIVQEAAEQTEDVSFSADVVPIFNSTCISCHDGQITLPDLTSGQAYDALIDGNYVSVSSPEASVLIRQLEDDHPYAGALTDKEIQQIITWMEEGALNN